jgi:DNA-directed RNA polymerase beta' subunit
MFSFPEVQGESRGFSRRTAEFNIPGLNIPQSIEFSPVGPNQEIRGQKKRLRTLAHRQEKELEESLIEDVEFNLFTTNEIDLYAVVNVTNPDEEGTDTIKDLRMGPQGEGADCATCGNDLRGCPGHMGKIVLPPIMHPMTVDIIILVLSCICRTCSRLLVTSEDIKNAGITYMSGKRRLEAIQALIKLIDADQRSKNPEVIRRTCQHGVLGHGGVSCSRNPLYRRPKANKTDYRLGMYRKVDKDLRLEGYLLPTDIFNMLNAIPEEDALLLGFSQNSHPRTMILERLVVIPYCARPDLYQGGLYATDDLNKMYRAIINRIIEFINEVDLSKKEVAYNAIYGLVGHLMKNDSKLNQGNLKIQADLRTRINGKSGIIRGNLMGKRVDFAGRTVIGPAHYLRVDEIGIPRLMAVKLTRPITVFEMNRQEMQAKYDSSKVTHITLQTGQYAGIRLMLGDWFRQKYQNYQLQTGDICERMLEDGDIVLVNRQPTLHKQNILALYARIIDDRIVRINLSITTPLNAREVGINREHDIKCVTP